MLGLKDEMPIGKHQGSMLEEIIEDDPDYIEWCIENVEWFYNDLDEEVIDLLKEKEII